MAGILDGKVAVITGAGSGIGRAMSKIFAREGARLVLADVVRRSRAGNLAHAQGWRRRRYLRQNRRL
jgi:NAD(P)-dependent dehydrogenase (short-subunit alcohol dehydrogenase family)